MAKKGIAGVVAAVPAATAKPFVNAYVTIREILDEQIVKRLA
jgi:hypothetical protein